MDYLPAIILAIIIIALVVAFVIKKAKFKDNEVVTTSHLAQATYKRSGIIIPIEQLSSLTEFNEKSLFEIKDNTVISRITATIPNTAEVVAKTVTNNALKNAELYKAVIPSGATLTKSKEMTGAVRGYFHGAKGVKGQANLVKIGPADISKASSVASGIANVMNVGSLVVGQYYMAEINSKIEALSKDISKISDFQNREFKSWILSLIALVGEISKFSSEIMESDDLRNRKLQTLDDLKGEGSQLLQQINLEIDEIIKKNQNPNYVEYQEKIDDLKILLGHQQILMSVLEEIGKLTHLLGKGAISTEMSFSIFNTYLKQSNLIRTTLEKWHEKQVDALGIDIDKNRIGKIGIEKIVTAIPGFVNDDWNYKELEVGLGLKITAQKTDDQLMFDQSEDVYDKDVQIIIKDGKYYYLHETSKI